VVELRVATLRWEAKGRRRSRLEVTLGSGAAAALGPALRRRLHETGATFDVIGDAGSVRFVVGEPAGWVIDPTGVTVSVPLAEVDGLAAMLSGRTGSGRVAAVPDLRLVVVA
jgi:hypothetical protein